MGHNPTFAFTSNKSLKDIEKMQFRDFLPFFDTDVIENKQKRAFFLLCALVLIRNFLQYISHYRKSSGVSRIRLICKACRSISDKVYSLIEIALIGCGSRIGLLGAALLTPMQAVRFRLPIRFPCGRLGNGRARIEPWIRVT
ncbi:MAG: hypothetical protein BECKG1743F_GA0114225_106763 [Candidatus Kentron sp. G]|nr:MAG: hypothetical protein BECKG1743F_GA0114225_106763 [Candidatus Kentron sp. G]